MNRNPKLRGFDEPSYTLLAGVEQQLLYVPEHILLQIPWMTDAIKAGFITPTQPIKLPQYNPEALAIVFHILRERQIEPIKQIHEHTIPTVETAVARAYFGAYLVSCRLSLSKAEQLLLFHFGRYMDLAPAEAARMLSVLKKEGLETCRLYNLLDYRFRTYKSRLRFSAYLATKPGLYASKHGNESMTKLAEQLENTGIQGEKYSQSGVKQAPQSTKPIKTSPGTSEILPHPAVPAEISARLWTRKSRRTSTEQATTDPLPLPSPANAVGTGTPESSAQKTCTEPLDETPSETSSLASWIAQAMLEEQRMATYPFDDEYEDPNVEWWADDLFHD